MIQRRHMIGKILVLRSVIKYGSALITAGMNPGKQIGNAFCICRSTDKTFVRRVDIAPVAVEQKRIAGVRVTEYMDVCQRICKKRHFNVGKNDAGQGVLVKMTALRNADGNQRFAACRIKKDIALCGRIVLHNILVKRIFRIGCALRGFIRARVKNTVFGADKVDAFVGGIRAHVFFQGGMNFIGVFVALIGIKNKEIFGAVQIGHRRDIFLNGLVDIIALCPDDFRQRILRVRYERFSGNFR